MEREFIMTSEFDKKWKQLGFSDIDLSILQYQLLSNIKSGDVIVGTGGLRKERFSIEKRGKRSGLRIIYVDLEKYEKVYLITVYPKSTKNNLSDKEKKQLKNMVEYLEKLERGKSIEH